MACKGIAGCILAGGRSSRMGGRDKSQVLLGGRPLLEHVIERVEPQVVELTLSVEAPRRILDHYGLLQLPDPLPGFQGPLGGLLSALRHFRDGPEWVLLAPCDAPFLPTDLATRLLADARAAAAECAAVEFAGELQPTFSIWRRDLHAPLERAVLEEGLRGLKQFMGRITAVSCAWPDSGQFDGMPPPFYNINDEAALQRAECWFARDRENYSRCSV